MVQHSEKRSLVLSILDGQIQPDSPVIERSVLTALAGKPRPNLQDPQQIWFTGVPLLLLYAGACMLFREQLNSPALMAVIILGFLTLTSGIWYFARKRDDLLRREARVLKEPVEELKDLQKIINQYVGDLDRRTSKYFHLVTNSKVTSYFALTQITQALQTRITEVEDLLKAPRRENLLISHQLLQGTLVFSDSFGGGAGSMHVVPLARLKTTVLQLFHYLDSELKLLEEELVQTTEPSVEAEDFGEPH